MEKSLEQLKRIERISRQTRHHQTHLNQVCDQNLRRKLNHLAIEREQSIVRSASRRQFEEERKQFLNITIKQLVTEQQHKPLSTDTIQTEQAPVQILSEKNEIRPSSSIRLYSPERSCRLFSSKCQLYPCQPIHQYTSIISKEHDQTLQKRKSSVDSSIENFHKPYLRELFTPIEENKHQQKHRQLATAIQNQRHQAHRHLSMQRAMARLDEQSRLLHEQLTEKRKFGYVKERQHQLSQAIQRHLGITAKFCS